MHLDGVWGRRYNGGHGIMNMKGIISGLVFFALQSVAGVGAQLFPVFIEIRDPFVFWETEWSWPWRESVQCRLCGVLDAETRSTFDTCQLSSVQGEQEVSSSVKHGPSKLPVHSQAWSCPAPSWGAGGPPDKSRSCCQCHNFPIDKPDPTIPMSGSPTSHGIDPIFCRTKISDFP